MRISSAVALILAVSMLITGCGFSSERKIIDPEKVTPAESYSFEKLSYDGVEKQDFSCLLEAEEAKPASGISVKADRDGYSGEGYVDVTDNAGFRLTVEIPSSQFYKVTVRHCADSHKENEFNFNGSRAFRLTSEAGDWVETSIDGVFLEKGLNEITLDGGWSWFSIDWIKIENGNSLEDKLYTGMSETLSNQYANLKTQNIYQYLRAIYGERTLAGQCTDYGHNTETDALYKGLGKYPAVRTFDFIYDSPSYSRGNQRAEDVDLAIKWSRNGGLVVYDWHWYAPMGGSSFYAEDTTFNLANAVTDIDVAHMSLKDIKELKDDKKINRETYKLIEDIDSISALMQRMEDKNVTVLWRPLHEASGGWFWWGASGPEAYKWLWRLMYERMTDYHELDNLIWIWNAQSGDWYPGDEYCDIAALDIYNSAHDYSVSAAAFSEMYDWTAGEKMITMSECATMPDPDLIVRDNAYWLWFAVWNWDYIVVNGTTELSEAYTDLEMMKKVYNSEVIITRDELPDF